MSAPRITTLAIGLAVLLSTGCGKPTPAQNAVSPPAPTGAAIPAALFSSAAPDGAVSLADVKSQAKPGDRVVFEARIGGRRDAFVENRAIFFVADSALLSCDQLHGDRCKTPWDYCCEPRDSLLRNMATVQIVDDGGRPLQRSLQDQHGLAPLRTVFVSGTVKESDDTGNFVVNAESIYVKEG